jgi:hypothetical protein
MLLEVAERELVVKPCSAAPNAEKPLAKIALV